MTGFRFSSALLLCLSCASPVLAQYPYSTPYGQQYGANPFAQTDSDQLANQLRILAADPRNLNSLIEAARLSLKLGDTDAATALYSRANAVDQMHPRVKAGMGRLLVQSGRPGEALLMFDLATRYGATLREFGSDRALAYDLIGEQDRAQREYRALLRMAGDDEATRRYALSLGISGKTEPALALLEPLNRRHDRGAWRARAFVLAMDGNRADAEKIATAMMPAGMAQGLTPFFARLPKLGATDRAFAIHFGELRPGAGRAADRRFAPRLPALAPEPDPFAKSKEVAVKEDKKSKRDRRKRKKGEEEQVARVIPLPPPPRPTAGQLANLASARMAPAAAGYASRPVSTVVPASNVVALPSNTGAATGNPASTAAGPPSVRLASAMPLPRTAANRDAEVDESGDDDLDMEVTTAPPAAVTRTAVVPSDTADSGRLPGVLPVRADIAAAGSRVPASGPPSTPVPVQTAVVTTAQPSGTVATTASDIQTGTAGAQMASLPPSGPSATQVAAVPPPAVAAPAPGTSNPAPTTAAMPTSLLPQNDAAAVVPTASADMSGVIPGVTEVAAGVPGTGEAVAFDPAGPNASAAVADAAPTPAQPGFSSAFGSTGAPPPAKDAGGDPVLAQIARQVATPKAETTTATASPSKLLVNVEKRADVAKARTQSRTELAQADTSKRRNDRTRVAAADETGSRATRGKGRTEAEPDSRVTRGKGSKAAVETDDCLPAPAARVKSAAKAPSRNAAKPAAKGSGSRSSNAAKGKTVSAECKVDSKGKKGNAAVDEAVDIKGNPSRIWLQIASGADDKALGREFGRVAARSAALKGRSGWSTPWRSSNRILVGPFKSQKDARDLLNAIGKDGISGFIYTSPKGEKVERLSAR